MKHPAKLSQLVPDDGRAGGPEQQVPASCLCAPLCAATAHAKNDRLSSSAMSLSGRTQPAAKAHALGSVAEAFGGQAALSD